MNKQEQIEKMAIDIVGDILLERTATETAQHLVEKGYINGADFVEWLKQQLFLTSVLTDESDTPIADVFGVIDKALQEYLKGE